MSNVSFPPADHARAAAISASRDQIWRDVIEARHIIDRLSCLRSGPAIGQRMAEDTIKRHLTHLDTAGSYTGVLLKAVDAERSIAAREKFSWSSAPTWIWNRICSCLGSSPLVRRCFGAYFDRRDQTIAAEKQLRDASWNLVGRMVELNGVHDDLRKFSREMELADRYCARGLSTTIDPRHGNPFRDLLSHHRLGLTAWDRFQHGTDTEKVLAACHALAWACDPAGEPISEGRSYARKAGFVIALADIGGGLMRSDEPRFRLRGAGLQQLAERYSEVRDTAVREFRALLANHLPAGDAHAARELRRLLAIALPSSEATAMAARVMRDLKEELHAERARGDIAADDPLLSFVDTPADIWERDCVHRGMHAAAGTSRFRCLSADPAECLHEAAMEAAERGFYKENAIDHWLLAARGAGDDEARAAANRRYDGGRRLVEHVQDQAIRTFRHEKAGTLAGHLNDLLAREIASTAWKLAPRDGEPPFVAAFKDEALEKLNATTGGVDADGRLADARKTLSLLAGSEDRVNDYVSSLTLTGCAEQMFGVGVGLDLDGSNARDIDDIAVEMGKAVVWLRRAQIAREQEQEQAPATAPEHAAEAA